MGVAMRLRTPNLHAALASSSLPVCSAGRTSFLTSLQVPTPLRSSCHLPSLALNRRAQRSTIVMQAADGSPGPTKEEEEVIDNKILQYCSIDKKTAKRTVGELEQEFLEALQSFYYEGKPMMSNEEFDNLKEELMWEGSSIVMLSPDEQRFMEASLAYAAGKPILTDAAYDELKMKLKVYSDCTVDYLKMTLLNVPAALVALGFYWLALGSVLESQNIPHPVLGVIQVDPKLPEPYSFLFTWFIVLPVTYLIAQSLTNVIVKDPLILKGPCPNCGGGTTSFFGTILTIPSGGSVNTVQCESCKSSLLYDLEARLITLDPTPPKEKKSKAPKKAVASS
ncbi:hypothetical protein AXG93_4874s1360 [Marchantia polymorpha subsp. ruderalis]|uniref:PGR5-like protein 1A, chloroplastic n=1 Tax=Marchantia polymorpha subsp. ruderalis TaxID=1480154 RepID=A0A176WGQ2_MARPO|nr:hypothetical protein AXG93_4874s1360 [Marchantia polymorpha subsp. ruderalis]